ncbi:thioredoxin-dependent thiol peroxidase [Synechococcus sp. HJ21-Hayes]|uniref:thioredoxin-dependent thiol peroxidase n=1 Tax=unclassified Synechococcus TaxID=2626047 RepID=UPI0020CC1CF8|nr:MULTISPECIES: thioredoxin-dependent thiol peroxidase [unclassified Synechococcus]MCP9831751.1 thioredoxin-dependent thiol peroxidase [Synechococcus sp. JJ3a-Johnson]MCP9853354.1 thioredoxin-dependent thiol peroxidase [Synechococcus sp. HJ21-Hayes]
MTLQIGDAAPEFSLPNQNGNTVNLADFRGQRVVIYFYPKDDTPGCTKEACNFRDQWSAFEQHGIAVLGISKDGATSHVKFINKYTLPFTLLSDAEPCPVAESYGSYGLKKFMGRESMGMMRHTFVVDSEGRIEKAYWKVKADTMADDILKDLGLA